MNLDTGMRLSLHQRSTTGISTATSGVLFMKAETEAAAVNSRICGASEPLVSRLQAALCATLYSQLPGAAARTHATQV